jgi:integrase
MRRGEILGLRWSDIDLKAGRLTVNQSLEWLGGKTTFKPPKTVGSREDNLPPCPNPGDAVGTSFQTSEDQ